MILALLLQAAIPPAAPAPAPSRSTPAGRSAASSPAQGPLDPAQAVTTFRDICIAHWRDADALHEAMMTAPAPFTTMPKHDPSRPGESWRAPTMTLSYLAAGAPGMVSPQCSIRGTMKGGADQLSFAARVAAALKLHGGATRTGSGQAITEWPLTDPSGSTRVLAMTRNAAGGGTELRLAILPAARPMPPP